MQKIPAPENNPFLCAGLFSLSLSARAIKFYYSPVSRKDRGASSADAVVGGKIIVGKKGRPEGGMRAWTLTRIQVYRPLFDLQLKSILECISSTERET